MKIKKSKVTIRGEDKWMVSVHYQGKRRRKYFNNPRDMKNFDELEWIMESKKQEPAGDETLLCVARDEYLKEYQLNNQNDFKPRQKGYETTEQRINRFLRFIGDKAKVSSVTTKHYHEYLDSSKLSLKSKQGYASAVRMFMAWCGKQGFGTNSSDWYIKTNQSLKMTEKKTFFKLPEILTIEQTEALLASIPDKYRPALAIMLFTGIRPEIEMDTLDYSHIEYGKRIGLRAEHTKTGRERWIVPPENLWAWLPKKKSGKVMHSYSGMVQARRRACRRAYGWENNGRKGGGGVKGFDYPANGARHSFGSYGYWFLGFESALDIMGHMSSETFLRNYKNNRVDKETAQRYFQINPL
jgi:hypothetical protein